MPELLGALTKSLLDPILIAVVLAIYFYTKKLSITRTIIVAFIGACLISAIAGWLSAINGGTGDLFELRSIAYTFIAFLMLFFIVYGVDKLVSGIR